MNTITKKEVLNILNICKNEGQQILNKEVTSKVRKEVYMHKGTEYIFIYYEGQLKKIEAYNSYIGVYIEKEVK